MKLNCEVLGAATTGDGLVLTLQGQTVGAAEWRRWNKIYIEVPDTKVARKAFQIGRRVIVTVDPQP
jgi:hypothetical protein